MSEVPWNHSAENMQHLRNLKKIEADEKDLSTLKMQYTKLLNRYERLLKMCDQIENIKDEYDPDGFGETVESTKDFLIDELQRHLVEASEGKRSKYSTLYYEFSFVIFSISPKCYRYLRNIIPLPCKSSIYNHFSGSLHQQLDHLENLEESYNIIDLYQNTMDDEVVPICLGMDATELFDDENKKRSGVMVYQIQPLKFLYTDFIVHFNHGEKINHDVHERVDNLCEILEESKFIPVFISSDGDKGSDSWHVEAFGRYEQDILDGKSVFEIIDSLGELIRWPTSDLMHLLKNERDKSLHSELFFDEKCDSLDIFNFETIVSEKATTNDTTEIGTMKDSYVIDLYSLKSTINCIVDQDFIELAFILPFQLILTALTSRKLNIDARIQLLAKSFEFFAQYYINYPKTGKNAFLRQNAYKGHRNLTYFTKMKIIRVCNSIIGYIYAFIYFPDFLATNRMGTYPVECFFGCTRSVLNNDNRLSNFIRSFNKIQMQKQIIDHLGLSNPKKRFCTRSGVYLQESEFIDFEIKFPNCSLYDLLSKLCHTNEPDEDFYQLADCMLELFDLLLEYHDFPEITNSLRTSGSMITSRLHEKANGSK